MTFYVCDSFNEQGHYSGRKVLFFNSEVEKIDFSEEFYEKNGEDAGFHLCNSLKEIIVDISIGRYVFNDYNRYKEIDEIYNDIISKFGVDFVHEKFPKEELTIEFIKSIEDECDKFLHDSEISIYENEVEYDDDSDGELFYDNETAFYDNEMQRWDEENPTWRIENDFG